MQCKWRANAELMKCHCIANAVPVQGQCNTTVVSMQCQCTTNAEQMQCQCTANSLPIHCQCTTNVQQSLRIKNWEKADNWNGGNRAKNWEKADNWNGGNRAKKGQFWFLGLRRLRPAAKNGRLEVSKKVPYIPVTKGAWKLQNAKVWRNVFTKVDLLLGSIPLGSWLPHYYELFLQINTFTVVQDW